MKVLFFQPHSNYCIEQCKQRQYFEDSSSWLFLKNLVLTSLGCPLVYLVTRCCHLILLIHMIWLKEIQLYQIFCHILETATDCSVTINNSSYKAKKNMKVHFWDTIAQHSLCITCGVMQERFICGYTRTFYLWLYKNVLLEIWSPNLDEFLVNLFWQYSRYRKSEQQKRCAPQNPFCPILRKLFRNTESFMRKVKNFQNSSCYRISFVSNSYWLGARYPLIVSFEKWSIF